MVLNFLRGLLSSHEDVADRSSSDLPPIPGYDVLWRLAGGGHAEVFVVRKHGHKRKLALKLLRPHVHAHEWMRAHFLEEFHILRTLKHPHIARAYEWGQLPDGRGFFTLERYTGGTLKDWLWRRRLPEDTLSPCQAARIALTVTDAMAYAHRMGVVHRDLKLRNVAIAAGGALKVIDWGTAKVVHNWGLTPLTLWVGTHGRTPDDPTCLATPALDIFSIGAMLYEMLTDQVPSQMETLPNVEEQEPFAPRWSLRQIRSDVPLELDKIVLTCLQREPNDRFRGAEELAHALQGFLAKQARC